MSEFPHYDIANYIDKKRTINTEQTPIPKELDIPKIEKLPRDLVKIAETVAHISGTWNPVEIYTADEPSIATEKTKVFEAYDKDEEYNPQLTYGYAQSLNLTNQRWLLERELRKLRQFGEKKKRFWQGHGKKGGKMTLERGTRLFRAALYYKIKDDLATCDLVDGIKSANEEQIATALRQKYPGTDQSLMDNATAELVRLIHEGDDQDEINSIPKEDGLLSKEEINWLKNKELTPEQVTEAFRWALKDYGILRTVSNGRGFYVKVSPQATSIDVRSKSTDGPTVFVPKDRSMSAYKLLTLMAHEIEGHARQDVNGEELFFLGGGRLKVDNEELYEGLGLRYEFDIKKKLFGVTNTAPSPYYSFAVRMAEEGASFFKIFKDQMDKRMHVALKKPLTATDENLSGQIDLKKLDEIKKASWLTTYRVMRGHIDMSNKGKFAMCKDLGYLRGFMMDKQLRDNDLGFLNEEGIMAKGGLAMLAELKVDGGSMPIHFKDVTTNYWYDVLKPQMRDELKSKPPAFDVVKQAEDVARSAWERKENKEAMAV